MSFAARTPETGADPLRASVYVGSAATTEARRKRTVVVKRILKIVILRKVGFAV